MKYIKFIIFLLIFLLGYNQTFAEISDSIKTYTVQRGDNGYWKIQKKLGIKERNALVKLNNYENLYPGKKIIVSFYNGKIVKIKNKDIQTVENLSYYYKVSKKDIISANLNLINKDNNTFDNGDIIFIPHGQVYKEIGKELKSKKAYKLEYNHKTKRLFPEGQCTWFVSQYKEVNWYGNAKDWYGNAINAGYEVGKEPKLGSTIVFKASKDYPVYGHVAIVYSFLKRNPNKMIIVEMNYKGLGIVSYRIIDKNDKNIKGYIYN